MSKVKHKVYPAHGGFLQDLKVGSLQRRKEIERELFKLPRIILTQRQLCDVELLIHGGFSPLNGFMDEEDYVSVMTNMRLKNGTLWSIPIVLDVNSVEKYSVGLRVILCDEYNKPIVLFTITSIYKADKNFEALSIYGTNDQSHFGVEYIMSRTGKFYLGGKTESIGNIDHYDFLAYRHTPKQLHDIFAKKRWEKVIGFQTRNPLHKAHYVMIKEAAKKYDAHVLLHPVVGTTKDGDIDYVTRTRSYIALYDNYIYDFAFLSLLPYAMRMAGPREAILHAIIRKNYGCTHFIIGRDHAGPGKNKKGISFYGSYQAQELVKAYSKDIGITPIFFQEMAYVSEKKKYLAVDKIKNKYKIKKISGTKFRNMIRNNKKIPSWFSFPEVITEIKKGIQRQNRSGLTIFFTGLPCAGKSTIARHLNFRLLEIQDKNVTFLDGDVVRQNLSKELGFTKKDRDINIGRIGFVANEITKHGGITICAVVAPYKEARDRNRKMISINGNYVEVYISTPTSICIKRDVKGLYKMAKLGKLKGMTGIDDTYEPPINPEITINTENKTPHECVDTIVDYLINKKLIT